MQSAIVTELEPLRGKLSFWGIKLPNESQTLWESNRRQPGLDQLLSLINEKTFLEADEDLKALCGIGWEFIWGKPTPDFVNQQKALLRQLAAQEEGISDLERLWLTISAVDTDYF